MRLFVADLFLEVHAYSVEPIRPLLQPVSACAVVASWRALPHDKSTLTSQYLIRAPRRKKNDTKLVACAKSDSMIFYRSDRIRPLSHCLST
jgi:hypothetical protein